MATDVRFQRSAISITEGTLAQWLKQPGDAVASADEPIASLETDKVTVGSSVRRSRVSSPKLCQGRRNGRGRSD